MDRILDALVQRARCTTQRVAGLPEHAQGRIHRDDRRHDHRHLGRVRPYPLPVPGSLRLFDADLRLARDARDRDGHRAHLLLPAVRGHRAEHQDRDRRAHHVLHRVRGRGREGAPHPRSTTGWWRRPPISAPHRYRRSCGSCCRSRRRNRRRRDARVHDLARRRCDQLFTAGRARPRCRSTSSASSSWASRLRSTRSRPSCCSLR